MQIQSFRLVMQVLLVLVLFGCKKSDVTPAPVDQTVIKSVKQVAATNTDFVSYEYDLAGNVTKYVSQWQNGAGGINRLNNIYEYNGNKLVKFSNEAGYGTFHYNGNVLETSEHFANNNKKISSFLYQYDATGKIISLLEQIANPEPDAASQTKITYQYRSDGNLSRIDFFYRKDAGDAFVLTLSKVFAEYDDKKNPEPDGVAGFFIPGVVLLKNNPVKINNLLPNGTIEGYSRYEYTYNSSGYPVIRKHFIAVGNVEHPPVQFTYTY